MSIKNLVVIALTAAIAGFALFAAAQWQQSEEHERIMDRERQETLYEGSTDEERDRFIEKHKEKDEQAPDLAPGRHDTPAEAIEGPSHE